MEHPACEHRRRCNCNSKFMSAVNLPPAHLILLLIGHLNVQLVARPCHTKGMINSEVLFDVAIVPSIVSHACGTTAACTPVVPKNTSWISVVGLLMICTKDQILHHPFPPVCCNPPAVSDRCER